MYTLQRLGLALVGLLLGMMTMAEPAAARTIRIVAFGDSLTAGYMLPASAAFPPVLEKALKARGHDVTVANAGVSGETAADGLARLDWSVPDTTDIVIVELGANDMLRGLDPGMTRQTLGEIISRLQARHIQVLLAGMLATPSLGARYVSDFDAIYPALAKQYGATLYPFFLNGIAANPKFLLADGLHPNAAGVEVIAASILPFVETVLKNVR
jgi:acyl-CoA thioesterase-1